MRSYLLGTLDSDRRTQLEDSILSDSETYEELLVAEEELIDQYVAGRLSELEQQQFEAHFLITAERQKNLRFGQLLNRYVNSHRFPTGQKDPAAVNPPVKNSAPAPRPFWSRLSSLAGLRAMALSLIAVALLGLLVLCWLASRSLMRSSPHTHEPIVTVTLLPGSIIARDTRPQNVNVPPKGYKLKLELGLAKASFHNYKSELFRENKSVETRGELRIEAKGDQFVVPVTITGEMLSPGDYQLKLSGVLESGVDEFIEKYSFRIIE